MPFDALSVPIVGADYPNKDGGNRRSEIAFCEIGETLTLMPEPRNPHDEHAIAVFSARHFQIGYVSSLRAVLLGKLMREGHELHARLQDIAPFGAVARVGVDHVPELPTGRLSFDSDESEDLEASDIEFYPDYQPPDD